MRLLSRIAAPVVWLLTASTDAVLRGLGQRPVVEPPVTESEFRLLLRQGTEAGVFEAVEHEMVQAVFRLGDRRVSAVMTPRTEVVWLDLDDAPADLQRQIIANVHHACLPVGRGSLDNVLGMVHTKDLLVQSLTGQPLHLEAAIQQPLFIPESMRVLQVLELFKQARTHLALVVDEYGGMQGIVTLHDIFAAVVGDVPVAGEPVEPRAVQREDGSWLLDGLLPIDECKELLRIGPLPGEEQGAYQMLSGFVMLQLGRIPVAADHFVRGGYRFEVVDMDGHRVDKVLVTPVEPVSSPPLEP
jgi:putative hemolysin